MWMPVLTEDTWLQIQGELEDILALQEQMPPGLALLQEQLRTLQLERNADNGASSLVMNQDVTMICPTVHINSSHNEETITVPTPARLQGTSSHKFCRLSLINNNSFPQTIR
jgi:hypothetical protein